MSEPIVSPFLWRGKPIVFSKDRKFKPEGESGLSQSERSSLVNMKHAKDTGEKRGTIRGLSKKADAILAARPHGGAYTKVKPGGTD